MTNQTAGVGFQIAALPVFLKYDKVVLRAVSVFLPYCRKTETGSFY